MPTKNWQKRSINDLPCPPDKHGVQETQGSILKMAVVGKTNGANTAVRQPFPDKDKVKKKGLAGLERRLGYAFKDRKILREALTHPGVVGASKKKVRSNQRLEFLGDAVLQSVISDAIFRKFDSLGEGRLTKIRTVLTRGSFLAELSWSLHIPSYLALPPGAEEIRFRASAAEDALEAVVGAVYVDAGFESARSVVLGWYGKKLDEVPGLADRQNPKGTLQELAAKRGESVEYVLLSQSGPDHRKVFEMEVRVASKPYARASAGSKKAAEIKAAASACAKYSKFVQNKLFTPQEAGENPRGSGMQKGNQLPASPIPFPPKEGLS